VGYVVDRRSCPASCPSGPCDPCQESIVVSDTAHPVDKKWQTDGNTLVEVAFASKFTMGAKVKLRVTANAMQPFIGDPCCSRIAPYVVRAVDSRSR
jgi:hypothetical protein